jgi:hypothetical protein
MQLKSMRDGVGLKIFRDYHFEGFRCSGPALVPHRNAAQYEYWLLTRIEIRPAATSFIEIEKMHSTNHCRFPWRQTVTSVATVEALLFGSWEPTINGLRHKIET